MSKKNRQIKEKSQREKNGGAREIRKESKRGKERQRERKGAERERKRERYHRKVNSDQNNDSAKK